MRLRKMQPYGLRKSPQRATFASANNWNNSIEPESQREVIGIQQAWLALDKRLKDVVTIEVPTPTLTLKSRLPLTYGDHISTAISIDRTMSTRQPLESDTFRSLL